MRLIDADLLMDEIAVLLERNEKLIDDWLANVIDDTIEEAPTVDAVEVVRCGKCDWWNSETKGCKRNPCVKPWWEDDYCSYGERRTE